MLRAMVHSSSSSLCDKKTTERKNGQFKIICKGNKKDRSKTRAKTWNITISDTRAQETVQYFFFLVFVIQKYEPIIKYLRAQTHKIWHNKWTVWTKMHHKFRSRVPKLPLHALSTHVQSFETKQKMQAWRHGKSLNTDDGFQKKMPLIRK